MSDTNMRFNTKKAQIGTVKQNRNAKVGKWVMIANQDEKALKEYIKSRLDLRDLLEGLSEEATEVGVAALKYIRASGMGKSWTPLCEGVARQDLVEEFTDLLLTFEVLSEVMEIKPDKRIRADKLIRWAGRLKDQEK